MQGMGTVTAETVEQAVWQIRTEAGMDVTHRQLVPLVTSSRHVRILDTEPCSEIRDTISDIRDLFTADSDFAHWCQEPNLAFRGRKPEDLMQQGDWEPLKRMLGTLGSGEPG